VSTPIDTAPARVLRDDGRVGAGRKWGAAASVVVVVAASAVFLVSRQGSPDYSSDHAEGRAFAATHGIDALSVGQRVYRCMQATRTVYGDPSFLTPHYAPPGAERAFWEGCSGAIDD
jgi:hypothetical protein